MVEVNCAMVALDRLKVANNNIICKRKKLYLHTLRHFLLVQGISQTVQDVSVWLESLYQLLAVLYFLSYSAHHSIHAASFMTLAWGLVAPVGIILAMFYKVILPNGEWFYVSVRRVSMHSVFVRWLGP